MKTMDGKEAFEAFLDSQNLAKQNDRDFLYATFLLALDGSKDFQEVTPLLNMGVNPLHLALYLVNEHVFYLQTHRDRGEADLVKDEQYQHFLASVALDKYFTNERLAFRLGNYTNRFMPTMSTLNLYLNFILSMLSRYQQGDPRHTLIIDVMNKGFQMAKCVAELLEGGFETEAFSTWRTLHENECIMAILVRHGQSVVDAYLRHIRYGIAFRGGIPSKEETDEIFLDIKNRMHEVGLKSKDMKRFIEYGWLLGVPNVMEIENFKFNFRDGVEKVAGLSQYSKIYEMSSEIAHSSPLLIYSRKNYFFSITILNLIESFLRLEKYFTSLYMATAGEEIKQSYARMRSLYYGEITVAYQLEKMKFASTYRKKKTTE